MLDLSRKFLLPVIAASLLSMMLVSTPVYAITLKQATQQIKQQTGGKIVFAQTINQNGRRVHVIRYVTSDGVVRTAHIPE